MDLAERRGRTDDTFILPSKTSAAIGSSLAAQLKVLVALKPTTNTVVRTFGDPVAFCTETVAQKRKSFALHLERSDAIP
jgi:hypothetical protein